MSNSGLSPAVTIWEGNPQRIEPLWCSRAGGDVSVPSDFLLESQVCGLGSMHLLLTFNFFRTWFLPLFKKKTCHP